MGLHRRHFHPEDPFRLGRQRLDHILLQPTKHYPCQTLVQVFDLSLLILVVELKLVPGQLDFVKGFRKHKSEQKAEMHFEKPFDVHFSGIRKCMSAKSSNKQFTFQLSFFKPQIYF